MNRIVFVVSFSNCSLFIYRNATDFSALALYFATLLNLLVLTLFLVCGIFRVFLHVRSYHLQIENFTSSSPFLPSLPPSLPPSLFSSLLPSSTILNYRTSSTILNKSGKSGHPCLVPDLGGNVFRLSTLNMMLPVGLSYTAFIMLRYIPSIHTLLRGFFFFSF